MTPAPIYKSSIPRTSVPDTLAALTRLDAAVKAASDALNTFTSWFYDEWPRPAPGEATRRGEVLYTLNQVMKFLAQEGRVRGDWQRAMSFIKAEMAVRGAGTQQWWDEMRKMIWHKEQAEYEEGEVKKCEDWLNEVFMDVAMAGKEFGYEMQTEFVRRGRERAPALKLV